jgi:hypothetical protein
MDLELFVLCYMSDYVSTGQWTVWVPQHQLVTNTVAGSFGGGDTGDDSDVETKCPSHFDELTKFPHEGGATAQECAWDLRPFSLREGGQEGELLVKWITDVSSL